VILARGGSKGVPGKNLRAVGGLSLVARAVRAGRAAPSVTAVHVSTDDAAIAAEARRFGAEVIDRPTGISGDGASSESGWLHALEVIAGQGLPVDRLVFLQCTSPFTTGADIEACLAAMEEQAAACALSVIEDHSFLWSLDAEGRGRGTNHDERQPRQRQHKDGDSDIDVDVGVEQRVGGDLRAAPVCPVCRHDVLADDELEDDQHGNCPVKRDLRRGVPRWSMK